MTTSEKLIKIAENVQKNVEFGKSQAGGGDDDYYNVFWDEYQEKGKRVHWVSGFNNKQWNDVTYNPKYPFAEGITYAASMFQNSQITDTKHPLNFVNLRANAGSVFNSANKLKTIRTLTVAENTSMANWFQNCTALENIEIAGVIGQNLDIHWSVLLTAKSYHSIMTHLSKTASITLTLPAEATVRSVYDAKYGSVAWDAITAQYPNVTIMYS